jgi:UPF0755 protein
MRWLPRILLVGFLSAAAAGGGAWLLYGRAHEAFQGFPGAEQFVDVPPGTGAVAIGERLAEAGVVRDPLTFRAAVWLTNHSRDLKAGEYRFDRPASAVEVAERIARGDVYRRLLTFREGLTIDEMADVFASKGFGAAADFRAAAADGSLIGVLDPAARDLEGYLFPDTYALPRGTAAAELVRQMVEAFTRAMDGDLRRAIDQSGLSVREAVTLASLVEKETARADERPLVAAVYRNRLKSRMGMQADPTVIYALQKAGRWTGNLRRDDLQLDSPYNTYRVAGLPPGPIAAPGLASLEAVAHPAPVDYLYFVSRNDGSHAFASTLQAHNRNVQEWQIDYFRRKKNH